MITYKVWMLVVFLVSNSGHAGGTFIIDNIITQEECVRVQSTLSSNYVAYSRCVEVKVLK